MIFVTGGAGFLGANFVLGWLAKFDEAVVTLDRLTYAGNLENLASLRSDPRHNFVHGDICDRALVANILATHRPRAVIHFAAESHVDRSIRGSAEFLRTNVEGTYHLLEEARAHLLRMSDAERSAFRFLHVSTDEVYGSLAPNATGVTESGTLAPSSPYAASKAASDNLVHAWHRTYGLPVLIVRCSNNYGPYQFPEKLIPLMIVNALAGRPLPLYGDGLHTRDWLFVEDNCTALRAVLERGRSGETYNIGGGSERTNLEVVSRICDLLDELRPDSAGRYLRHLAHVADRPGHDRRYVMDTRKIERELGWRPQETFESGLHRTVRWYLDRHDWLARVQSGTYREWVGVQYGNGPPEGAEQMP